MGVKKSVRRSRFNLDKSFEHLFAKWQRNMFRLSKSLILLSLVIEIITELSGITCHVQDNGILGYCLRRVLLPFLINICVYLIGVLIYKFYAKTDEEKVMIPIVTMAAMVTGLVATHFVFFMLPGMFIIPLFISTIYANRKVVSQTFWCCCLGIAVSSLLIFITHREAVQKEYLGNVFIIIVMMLFALAVAMGSVENERAKVQTIKRNIRSAARLKEEACRDGLTGLYNRKTILDILDRYITLAAKENPLHIALVDIDHFKKINDTYGHSNGDTVLKALADMFRSMQGRDITVGRYGGEEFVIIFCNMPCDEVFEKVNELREKFSHCVFAELDNSKVTFSAGIASYSRNMDVMEFFDKADRAMYKAKQMGRNRVEKVC